MRPDAPWSRWPEPVRAAIAALAVAAFCALLVAIDPMFFWQDDYQTGILAGFRDVARAYDEGQWPLLSPYSWYAGNMGGELQLGTFSLFITPLVLVIFKLGLSLPLTAACYSGAHLMVLASGTWMLARHKGVSVPLAGVAVATATLNGWTMTWSASSWLSLLTSFAWLPWAWWAMERSLEPGRSGWRFLPPALFLYLLAAAGWPPTVAMAGLVTLAVAGRAYFRDRRFLALWPLALSWGVALALVSPAYLLFWDHLRHSARAATASLLVHEWLVTPQSWLAMVFPGFTANWNTFGVVRPHVPIEVANGLVAAVALLGGLAARRGPLLRRAGWELGLLALVMLLCMLPGFALFRWSFRWLPLVHLLVGLLGAMALTDWLAERPRSPRHNMGLWALGLVGAAFLLSLGRPVVSPFLGVLLLALAGLWAAVEAAERGEALRRWVPLGVTIASLWLTYRYIPTDLVRPVWPIPEAISDPAPFEPARRYMALAAFRDYFGPEARQAPFGVLLRPGNTGYYAGIEFINGYSSLGPRGLSWLLHPTTSPGMTLEVLQRLGSEGPHGYLLPEAVQVFSEREARPDGLLRRFAVDGLVLGRTWRDRADDLVAMGWQKVAEGPEGVVLHREGPLSPRLTSVPEVVTCPDDATAFHVLMRRGDVAAPTVEVEATDRPPRVRPLAVAALRPIASRRLEEAVEVAVPAGDRPALVVFARAWYPGFEATLDGRPLPVRLINMAMPGVEVPAGARGTLVLAFRPRPMRVGLAIAGLTLLALALGGLVTALRRLRAAAPAPSA